MMLQICNLAVLQIDSYVFKWIINNIDTDLGKKDVIKLDENQNQNKKGKCCC